MKKPLPLTDAEFTARIETMSKELGRESDRGLVLIAAAMLEENLEMLLRSLMRKGRKLEDEVLKPLFRSDGPLGSFASKSRICYAMELIDEPTFSDLSTVRSIRNDFAHSYSEASLASASVKDRIRNLKYHEPLTRLIPVESDIYFEFDREGGNRKRVSEEKRQFLLSFVMLSATLEGAIREFRTRQDERYGAKA